MLVRKTVDSYDINNSSRSIGKNISKKTTVFKSIDYLKPTSGRAQYRISKIQMTLQS